MNLCSIPSIDHDAGDFILLQCGGFEGINVCGQFPTVEAAIATAMLGETYGNPVAIVKLVRVSITVRNQ